MSLVDEVCACGKIKALMNSTNWKRHIQSCKKRKSAFSNANLDTFFKSARVSNDVSDKRKGILCLLLFSHKQILHNKLNVLFVQLTVLI